MTTAPSSRSKAVVRRGSGLALTDATLAHLHLRLGMTRVALAELEDLAARSALDTAGHADLAEARWRSGDVARATPAAVTHLEGGGHEPVALIIAAEGAAANGRPSEARAYVDRLGAIDGDAIDALFAGMPRRAFWPSASGSIEAATLFEADRIAASGSRTRTTAGRPDTPAAGGGWDAASLDAATGHDRGRTPTHDPGLWDADASLGAQPEPTDHLDPSSALQAGRALVGTDQDAAALRLALVLRLDPTRAPEVLDAIPPRRAAALEVVRGDAQRLLGRHLEAEAAYAAAASALSRRPVEEP